MSGAAERFLEAFGPNIIQRVEALEQHAERVDSFLFHDTEERPSLSKVITKADRHIDTMCDYAKFAKWLAGALLLLGSLLGMLHGYGVPLPFLS